MMQDRAPDLNERGFTLLELTIVLAIMAVLAAATVPYAATIIRNQAAEKTAREMLAVADAAKSYYVANVAWPASIPALQTAGFLPTGWDATNPFGNSYTASSATTFTVTTTVPTDVAPVVARLVPLGNQTTVVGGTSVAGTWPRPGQSSDLAAAVYPTGGVTFFDGTSCPPGMLELISAQGRTLVGLSPGGTLDGTVGGALADLENRTHTHTYSDVIAHTHTVSDPGHQHNMFEGGGGGHGNRFPLTRTMPGSDMTSVERTGISVNSTGIPMGTTSGTSATMPYLQLLVCRKS